MQYENIELFDSPRDYVIGKIDLNTDYIEMTKSESGFLCGLIKKVRPRKILEVGVAAGGTTAIVLRCLSELEMVESLFFSVDIDENYYRNPCQKTGYIVDKCEKDERIQHKFFFGDIAYAFRKEIGRDIDFLILDTVHRLPGELLDIITLIPFLAENCTVVLHDIAYNQYSDITNGYATGMVFSNLVGKKYLYKRDTTDITDAFLKERISGKYEKYQYPNIGGVQICADTRKYIDNLFLALITTWGYLPDEKIIDSYRKAVSENYESGYSWIFHQSVLMNKKTLENENKKRTRFLIKDLFRKIKKLLII